MGTSSGKDVEVTLTRGKMERGWGLVLKRDNSGMISQEQCRGWP